MFKIDITLSSFYTCFELNQQLGSYHKLLSCKKGLKHAIEENNEGKMSFLKVYVNSDSISFVLDKIVLS